MHDSLRIGAVNYLNSKPLIYEFEELAAEADLVLDVPSRLASDLAEGKLDVALVPVVEYFRHPGWSIVPDIAVASQGPVLSVTLFSRQPWPAIRRVALDEGSRTSAALTKILLQMRHQVRPEYIPLPLDSQAESVEADAVLLIGDRAMRACLPGFTYAYDLGQEWHDWTGLPFVYAFWAVREGVDLGDIEPAFQEAKRRGIAPEQLIRDEVQARTPEVTDDEVTAFMTQNRSRLPRGDEAELRVRVRDHLRRQQAEQQQQAFVDTLRARTPVTLMFPPRVPVKTDRGYSRGPADAPVVIVEFSDFQCPFCKTVVGTVKQAMDRYPGKVRWIFRDFPIAGLHPEAPKAHEAARCAGAQGKFWEYHDLLFERSPRMRPEDLKQYAADLKLDEAAFAQCLDESRFAAAVAADIEEGANLGITGTPIFYVNGRALVGAQPLSAFQRAIEGELPKPPAK